MSTTKTLHSAYRLEAFDHRMYVWKESDHNDWRGVLNDQTSKEGTFLFFKAENLNAAKLYVSEQARLRAVSRLGEQVLSDPGAAALEHWQDTILFVD